LTATIGAAALPIRFEGFFYVPLSGYFSVGSTAGVLVQQTTKDAQDALAGVTLTISVKNIISGTIVIYIMPDTAGTCYANFDLKTYDQSDGADPQTPPGSVYKDEFLLFKLPQQ